MADIAFATRTPPPDLQGLVARICGFASHAKPCAFVETAELVFPVVFNLGQPWEIGLGGGARERRTSFTAGLFPGPVFVTSDAGAELLQIDLTPTGAARLFGGAAAELESLVVDLESVDPFARQLDSFLDQLHCSNNWQTRFDLVEQLLTPMFTHNVSPQVVQSWGLLARGWSVQRTADAVGWSTRHLSTRFRGETGLRPVTAARMLRFQHARAMAIQIDGTGWADIAATAGYSDQAHLIREFQSFAGESPTQWAKREHPSAQRLQI